MFNKKDPFLWPKFNFFDYFNVLRQMSTSISIYDRSGIIELLEEKLKEYFKVKHALLTSSGTVGLFSVFDSLDLDASDEIIVPAYTFFATVTPILFTGAKPILVDSDKRGCISPEEIEKNITSKTKAIVITHMWGYPCDMDKILNISKKYNIPIVEDSSHAHGAEYKNKLLGTFGYASIFSMQGQKTLTGGEGGFILTNDSDFYYKLLLVGHYNKRCKQEIPKNHILYKYSVTGKGLKFRIHPLAARIAFDQLKRLDKILSFRRKKANFFYNSLKKIGKGIFPLEFDMKTEKPSWYAFIIKFDSTYFKKGVDRDFFVNYMHKKGFKEFDIPNSTRPLNLFPLFQKPEGLFPKYKNVFSYKEGDFPNAENFFKNIIKIPITADNSLKRIKSYIKNIDLFVKKYGR